MKDELLTRAAQANGHPYPWVMPNGFGERPWNPLESNEDALVLAQMSANQLESAQQYIGVVRLHRPASRRPTFELTGKPGSYRRWKAPRCRLPGFSG